MKITTQSQNPLEWLVMQTGIIPQPLLQAHFGFIMSKVIWEAVNCGVFEALEKKTATAATVAFSCQLDKKATVALLNALIGLQLLKYQAGKYALTKTAKKWLLKDSPESYNAMMLFDNNVCYDWMRNTGNYLRTGQGLQYHQHLQPQEWKFYQNGMTDIAQNISKLAAKKIKLSNNPLKLLDIGGAQGVYSNALLQLYPNLSAVVFDLPGAVNTNLEENNFKNEKLVFQSGNILEDDIGTSVYDVILLANVAHHFTEAENLSVAAKVFTALKPGGSFYILEFFKKDAAALSNDMIGALQSFFFAFSSTSGLWDADEIKTWLQKAGFNSNRIIKFLQLPGFGMVTGKK